MDGLRRCSPLSLLEQVACCDLRRLESGAAGAVCAANGLQQATKVGTRVIALPAVDEPADDLQIIGFVVAVRVNPVQRGLHFRIAFSYCGGQLQRQPAKFAATILPL